MSYADRALGTLESQTFPYNRFKPKFLDDKCNVRNLLYPFRAAGYL